MTKDQILLLKCIHDRVEGNLKKKGFSDMKVDVRMEKRKRWPDIVIDIETGEKKSTYFHSMFTLWSGQDIADDAALCHKAAI
jgi:hypothetical protein